MQHSAIKSIDSAQKESLWEIHIQWVWRDCWLRPRRDLHDLIVEAESYFAGKEIPPCSFWDELRVLPGDHPGWAEVVDSFESHYPHGPRGWTLRAFTDYDTHGNHYKAIEACAEIDLTTFPMKEELIRYLRQRQSGKASIDSDLMKELRPLLAQYVGLETIMFGERGAGSAKP